MSIEQKARGADQLDTMLFVSGAKLIISYDLHHRYFLGRGVTLSYV